MDDAEFSAFRQDAKEFLEFCQDTHVRRPLSESALAVWIVHLTNAGASESEIERKIRSVETLFEHIGIRPPTPAEAPS